MGPGTDEGRSIENAWLELCVVIGPFRCAAFAGLVLTGLVIGIRGRRWEGVSGVSALLVAYLLHNALEGAKPLTMVLLGVLFGLCLVDSGSAAHRGAAQASTGWRSPSAGVGGWSGAQAAIGHAVPPTVTAGRPPTPHRG